MRRRSGRALRNWVNREQHTLTQLRSRPVLARPLDGIAGRAEEIHRARRAARRDINRLLDVESDRIGHLSARLSTLGPAATLARGYAVVQAVPASGVPHVLQSVADAPAGRERVQVFGPAGIRIGGFTRPGRLAGRVAIGPLVLSGLPRAEKVVGPWSQVRIKCEDFFARHGIGSPV